MKINDELLTMAIAGYAVELGKIEAKVEAIRQELRGGGSPIQEVVSKKRGRKPKAVASESTAAPKKRKMSAAGRKRIAEAQRLRWEKSKAAKGTSALVAAEVA